MNKQYMDFVPAAHKNTGEKAKSQPKPVVSAPQKIPSASHQKTPAKPLISRSQTISKPARQTVPTKPARQTVPAKPARRTTSQPRQQASSSRATVTSVSIEEMFAVRKTPAGVTTGVKEARESRQNLAARFVKTEVKKRPLARSNSVPKAQPAPRVKPTGSTYHTPGTPVSSASSDATTAKAKKAKISAKTAAGLDEIFESALKAAEDPEPKKSRPKEYRSPFVNTDRIKKRPLSSAAPKNEYSPKKIESTEPKESVQIIDKPEKSGKLGTIVAIIITVILGATAGTVAYLLLPK